MVPSSSKEKNIVTIYTPGTFALSKLLDFLVSKGDRDKTALKTY